MIDKTFILALDKRRDLWEDLYHECLLREFPTELFIVGDGSRSDLKYNHIDTPGVPATWRWGENQSAQRHFWAFVSHKKIIAKALKAGYDNIMLYEDDSYMIPSRFDKHWPEVENFLRLNQPDVLYLGYHAWEYKDHLLSGHNLVIEENYYRDGKISFTKVPQCGGLFACIINKRMFPMLLNLPAVAPIDSQLNMHRAFINSFNILPMICYVRSTWSSCEDQFIVRDAL